MKFTKLSLAAIVALGTLSAANAKTPLEEAIKGTTVNGFVEARYYNEEVGQPSASSTRARYRIDLEVTTKIDDKLSMTVGLEDDFSESTGDNSAGAPSDTSLQTDNAYFTYNNAGVMVQVGRQNVATPWTDGGFNGTDGNGIFATYKVSDALTVGGAHFAGASNIADNATIPDNDIQAVALIGKVAMVDYQAWYLHTASIGSWALLDVTAPVGPVSIQGQYNTFKNDIKDGEDESFYALKLSGKFAGISANVGYMATDDVDDTKTRAKLVWIDGGDSNAITSGKLGYDAIVNYDDLSAYFVNASYTMDKITFSAGLVDVSRKADTGTTEYDEDEAYVQVAYKYNKKLGAALYYADRDSDVNSADEKEIRASVKYSF